jgi:hypothetical protein
VLLVVAVVVVMVMFLLMVMVAVGHSAERLIALDHRCSPAMR